MTDVIDTPVVIVTGASSGVGRDTAALMAEAGWTVVLTGRSEDKLNQTRELIEQDLPDARLLIVPGDLTDDNTPARLVDKTIETFGRLDALANVAGDAPLGPIANIDAEAWHRCIDTNLSAIVLLTAAAWPHLIKAEQSTIVNVSSLASIDPFPGFAMYAAAKVGVNMFTKVTADEGAKHSLEAVAIAPGAIETPMLRANFNEKMIPADQTLDPVTVASMIRACILGERQFTSGETVQLSPGD